MRKSSVLFNRSAIVFLLVMLVSATKLQAQYCTTDLYTTSSCDAFSLDYIQSFSTTGGSTNITNNGSGCTNLPNYTYYSTQTHTGVQGNTVNFSFTNTPSFPEWYKIWVDWNNDGTFDNTTEVVYASATSIAAGGIVNGSFTIPITATPGLKRLRIRNVYSTSTTFNVTPCTQETFGEVEDYNLQVIASAPCSGAPTGGTANATPATVCLNQPVSLSVTGASSSNSQLFYQWQVSTTGTGGPFTDIAGATAFNSSTTQGVTSYYRFRVICAATNDTAYSNVATVTSPPVPGGVYTISPTGTTWPAGTNFNSFNDAYNAIKCGISSTVIFNVVPGSGPYNEQLIMNAVPNASATRRIIFNGNGNTIQFASTNSNERAVIKLKGANFVTFDSLTINAASGTYGYGVQVMSDADSNTIKRCTIISSTTVNTQNFAGIVTSGSDSNPIATGIVTSDYNVFDSNTVTGGYFGATLTATGAGGGNSGNRYTNNKFTDFFFAGMQVGGSVNTLIEGNVFSRPFRTGVGDFHGIFFSTEKNVAAIISKNRIKNGFGAVPASTANFYGINFTNSSGSVGGEILVVNNLIYDANHNGPAYGIFNSASEYIYYLHNTVSLDFVTSTATGVTRGYSQAGASSGIFFYNNIISITRGGNGLKHGIYLGGGLIAGSDNNDFYVNSAGGNNHVGFLVSNRTTIAQWKAASGLDVSSVSANPAFIGVGVENYSPGNAGINDLGIYLGIDSDIVNNVRSTTTPDIGAYEFTPPPCSTPPTLGTTSITPLTVCQGNDVYFNLNIGAYGSAQTFTWESSTSPTGPFTAIGSPLLTPDTTMQATQDLYYRVAVTCGSTTLYTDTVMLDVNLAMPAGTYTINPGGGNTYNNLAPAPGSNFISFNAVKAELGCGILGPVVFNVLPGSGPYIESLVLDSIKGTSPTNTMTWNGNGNVITSDMFGTNDRAIIKLNGADYQIFDSLIVNTGIGTYGYGFQLLNNSDTNIIRKCTINTSLGATSNFFNGIVINAGHQAPTTTGNSMCDGNLITQNTINGGFYGIALTGGTNSGNLINDNSITNNLVQDFFSTGIYTTGTSNSLIEGNRITRQVNTINATSIYGIYVTGFSSTNLQISKNRIYKMLNAIPASTAATYGVYHNASSASSGGATIVSNNLIYDFISNGPVFGFYNNSSNDIKYYFNTISHDDIASTAAGATEGFQVAGTTTGIDFINNLISIRRGGNGVKHAINVTSTSTFTSNYNNFYVQTSGANSYVGAYNGNRLTLADWQNASGKDANSLSMDPVFKDPGNGDFTPGIVPLDNKGIPVGGITTDILNNPRSGSTPDIGAYEFTPPPCTLPITAGTASVVPSSGVCLEQPIQLNLTGNSPVGTITFVWQSSLTGAPGTWVDISPVQYNPLFNTTATVNSFFRASVTCNATTVYSTTVQVGLNTILPAGTYTIDGSNATSYNPLAPAPNTNFNTFNEAVTAMACGIGGKVTFNVVAGTYNEQVRIPYVPGTSNVATVTFQSANGNASSANLTFAANAAANYTLRLDSAKNIIIRKLTISGTDVTYSRVVELTNGAMNDTLYSNIISAAPTTVISTNNAGIYAFQQRGINNQIRSNTIQNGSYGIYYAGTSLATQLNNQLIDSNTVTGAYGYGIFGTFLKRFRLFDNTINVTGTAGTTYGIHVMETDTAAQILRNNVNITNTSGIVYGLSIANADSSTTQWTRIASNTINATTGNTSNIYGLYVVNSQGQNVVNNVISINTSGTSSYGLYTTTSAGNYLNNSVNSTATSPTNNYAAYFLNTGAANPFIRNNIFAHNGGGKAVYYANTNQGYSDYNMLYTTGPTLVQGGAVNYANVVAWRNFGFWDPWSISYAPAFISNTDLRPNLSNPDVWAMHGRGVHVPGNNTDFNNNPRPTTLIAGVPDLGAYEFFPTSLPTLLNPITTAVPNERVYMYGSDTVTKVTWTNTPPAGVQLRRYSGLPPRNPLLPPTYDSMYFYVQFVNAPPVGATFDITQYYIDPWQGSIPDQYMLGLGRTTESNVWVVGFSSRVDVPKRTLSQIGLNYMDKFTGLVNPYAPPNLPDKDSSNKGRRFWVGYPRNERSGSADMQMVLYFSATEAANVQVRVNGTNWVRNYQVAPNTVKISDYLPKPGDPDNAQLNVPGLSNRGISIVSDVPIVAYAHTIGNTSSGGTLLFPIGVWGYEYKMVGITQNWGTNGHSYYYVIADNDDTRLEITSAPGIAVSNTGITPGAPYIITLNKGQWYQVVASGTSTELSGSSVKSVPNSTGKCLPFAFFSGSSRTTLSNGCGSGGDFIMQQNFPNTAWGKKYLTAPSSASTAANVFEPNIYRVAVKDPATVVLRNGVPLTGLQSNFYYQFQSTTADYIEADKPISVAQFLTGACVGVGDPEMIYISPIQQGLNNVAFYRNDEESIVKNYVTLIIPTNGVASLVIRDGGVIQPPDFTYPHPRNPIDGVNYTVVIKGWTGAKQQVRVTSDSAFTAITYGLGSFESYGYNAGTLVKSLNATGVIQNTLNTTTTSNDFTCEGTSFIFKTSIPLRATKLTWRFSSVPNLSPNTNVVLVNPVPILATIKPNGDSLFVYQAPGTYQFSSPGIYPVQVDYEHPDIEGCDKVSQNIIYVQVVPAPKTNFSITPNPSCQGDIVQFAAESQTSNGINVNGWQWTFHDGSTANTQNTNFTYTAAGAFNVKLHTTTPDGCIGDSVKVVTVNPRPNITLTPDSVSVCTGLTHTFVINSPVTGVDYNWYTTPTGGTPFFTGTSYTTPAITSTVSYYIEAVSTSGSCVSLVRKKVTATVLSPLPQPVVTVQSSTPTGVTFSWLPVAGAASYQVSVNGGAFGPVNPGPTSHTVTTTGLQNVCVVIRAVGSNPCQNSESVSVCGCSDATVTVNPDSLAICPATTATFNVQSPVAGATYTWYTAATGGTVAGTGVSFTTPALSAPTNYFVGISNTTTGCTGTTRKRVVVSILGPLAPAIVTLDSAGSNFVRFSWTAVPGAASYLVSINGGAFGPATGPGLSHRVSNLNPSQEITIIVRAIGVNSCQTSESVPVKGRAINDNIYIPNSFSPNNDGTNDVLKVFSHSIKEMQFIVFNQWGEKVFESSNTNMAWDGKYKGKDQPSGVYMYVAKFVLLDNTIVERKGSVNLVR
jgi:trimeric autotransporter adhesin